MKNAIRERKSKVLGLFLCFLLLGIDYSFASYNNYSQFKTLSVSVNNSTLREVLKTIEKSSQFVFFYLDDAVNLDRKVSIDSKNKKIEEILSELFEGTSCTYRISDRQIFISGKAPAPNEQQQNKRKITGRVTDVKGEPLIGVNVTVDGDANGSITNMDGLYEIFVTKKSVVLKFTYIGFKTSEIRTNASTNIYDVALEEQVNELEETVIVGYGTQRKISNIGAQSSMKMEDIKTPSASLTTTLAGRLAGVVAVQRTGEPGKDAADIWIRGISTPNTSSPLVLVDGVERSFNDIDPEDIESLTTLKDASATAVYGVRGANGVILIKTKPGKVGKPTVSADYYESFTRFTKMVDLADGITYMNAANEAMRNDGIATKYTEDQIRNTIAGKDPYLYPNVDWLKEIFNDWGHNRRVNVNVRGGSEKVAYYASVSYFNETGMTVTDKNINTYDSKMKYSRYNFTTNLNIDVTPTTKVEIGAQGYLGEGNYPAISSADLYNAAMSISPVEYPKMFFVNGEAYVPGTSTNNNFNNPYSQATRRGYDNLTKNQIYSNLRITQDLDMLTKGLKLTAMYAFDVYNEIHVHQDRAESTYNFLDTSVPYDMDGQPILQRIYEGSNVLSYTQETSGNKKTYLEASLNYDRTFNDDHRVSALFLFNQQSKLLYPKGTLEDAIPYRMMGIAGRATYSWKDRYFAEFNIGYNGAENFSPKHRFGTFPAFGVGWVISNEKFWQPLSKAVSFLKIRYTDGKVGNSEVSDRRFMYLDQMKENGDYGYKFGPNGTKWSGYETVNMAVDLIWEESRKQDLGIDIKLFNDDLSIVFDLFKERRENILLKREHSIPSFLGYNTSAPYGNIGIIENKGFDGTIEYNKRINKDWVLALRGNITFNKDKWIQGELPEQKYEWMNQYGRNINGVKGYVAEGLFTQAEIDDMARWESLSDANKAITPKPFASQFGTVKAGDIKYKDLNNDGQIDAYDQTYISRGDVPTTVYGFGFTVGWKDLSVGMMFQGVAGAERVLNGSSINPFNGGGGSGNLYSNIGDRWTEENPDQNAFYPRLSYGSETTSSINNFQKSTWWVRNMNFLRLKTLQVSYNLPKPWVNKVHLKNAAVYVMGTNLFTLSRFKLWDPELNTDNGASYPNTTSYSVGINFTF
ncbi:Outer membrane TonB-dependent transporter, utilization system for glycans and polysaccharides (PUL), SusC family [Bacteroides ovatus]|uniref:TonB-dependent receptor n=1 Tax=Bacteroides TaxID=816 RepID=UPI000E915CD6|nr:MULTISPECIES: TonB-dependent receptor [Bacteroides]MCS3176081.1 TonB-dependent receptor [Candidatus Bacteroides intestinigallinarum]RGN55059.1 SusC/RagA family TonB-linked outer membrane protein [Bacteroides sp. OM05-10AA]RGQ59498.1 SusC/RagA family TonB-linked outer membrane protein [Bacteroides sp. AF27-33]CAG9900257.1 Outer membrane TonB-dependent transporter, utilization system for glycans and polysaccharides (PUL), SusC family [Bacteroides ovatus]